MFVIYLVVVLILVVRFSFAWKYTVTQLTMRAETDKGEVSQMTKLFASQILACLALYLLTGYSQVSAQNLVPLHLWWSPSRTDNFTTTDYRWRGKPGETRSPDYEWVGVLGYVIDPAFPRPPDTVPLYSWYRSNARDQNENDNLLTSDLEYPHRFNARGTSSGYRFVRLEGFAYTQRLAGTVPLQNHLSEIRKDHHTTTHHSWIGPIGKITAPSYRLYRNEGYVVAPRPGDAKPGVRDRFGIGRARIGTETGVPIFGTRPLLVITTQYSDVRLRHSQDYYDRFFFRDSDKSVASYFIEMSRGNFRWTRAGIVGPYTYQDRPNTPVDDSKFYCLLNQNNGGRQLCPGATGTADSNAIPATIQLAARDVDFSRYDTKPRDGKLESHELAVVYVGANPPLDRDPMRFPITYATSGSTRPSGLYGGCFPVSGIQFCATVSTLGEGTSTANAAHELFHLLDAKIDNDIYGSGNSRASLMAGTILSIEDEPQRFHLDPWHKMRAGWVNPLIRPILPQIPPDSAHLTAPALPRWLTSLYYPVLFFDPRGRSSDMFLMEHRRRQLFDANVADEGVAVWFARTDSTNNPFEVPAEILSSSGTIWSSDKDGDGAVDARGQTLWTLSAPEQRRGQTQFWRSEHGEGRLRWYPNPVPGASVLLGPDSNLRFRVGNLWTSSSGVDLEWRFSDEPFLARIDTIRLGASGYSMRGNFGLRGRKMVRLEPQGGGVGYDVQIIHWQADSVVFLVSDEVPEGRYFVRVYTDETFSAGGNRRTLTISRDSGLI
jgi:M6 family metalloprotease-like protein